MAPLQVPQTWCNSDIAHLDLSYWAFEILAHPVYGVMPLEFQPVDCTSNTPLTPFTPGFVNKTIYRDLVRCSASHMCCVSQQFLPLPLQFRPLNQSTILCSLHLLMPGAAQLKGGPCV